MVRPSRRIPLLRGFIGAGVCTFIALVSHVGAGGAAPGLLGVAVPWLLSLTVCTLLAGRRLSLLRLSAAVLVSQALFHLLFVLGSITPRGGFVPHVHGAPALLMNGSTAPLLTADAGMWAGHAIAAVATVFVLHRGERIARVLHAAASDLARWLCRGRPAHPVHPPRPARTRRWVLIAAPRPSAPHLRSCPRRGPPLLSAPRTAAHSAA